LFSFLGAVSLTSTGFSLEPSDAYSSLNFFNLFIVVLAETATAVLNFYN
jgi:hypothetical protein